MITITQEAAAQIRNSAEQTHTQGMFLRLAARQDEDGSLLYGMGFDDKGEDDTHVVVEGIDILISSSCKALLAGATLDFVEINPGEHQFIFVNPNDPSHTAPGAKPA
ncbi:MAG: iron-sulfur cluster biosynthesis family protein [Pseudomonadota bacterium]